MGIKINVIVTLQYPALHKWEEAPDNEGYLKYPHRHLFYITCKKRVIGTNREIETINLKKSILVYLNNFKGDFNKSSCEDIAVLLMKQFDLTYCSVLEDNENGAEIINEI
jgi:hypothetical protein